MHLSEKECLKQARAVLKKLAVKRACIVEVKAESGKAVYRVQYGVSGTVKKEFCEDVFNKLALLDWIMEFSEGYVLSLTGKAALRRGLSGGNDFAGQHRSQRTETRKMNGEKQSVSVVQGNSPLAWLARRKDRCGQPMISEEALQAGLRLEQDFYFAGLEPNVTANWNPAGSGGGKSRKHGMKNGSATPDHIMAAKDRVRKVVDHLGGQTATVLLDVCCFHQGLGQLEKSRQWPKRSGKVVLQMALQRLAEYYGIAQAQSVAMDCYRPLSSWGAEGYRPKVLHYEEDISATKVQD